MSGDRTSRCRPRPNSVSALCFPVGAGATERKPAEVKAAVLLAEVHVRAIIHDEIELLRGKLLKHKRGLSGTELPLTQPQGFAVHPSFHRPNGRKTPAQHIGRFAYRGDPLRTPIVGPMAAPYVRRGGCPSNRPWSARAVTRSASSSESLKQGPFHVSGAAIACTRTSVLKR